MSRAAYAAIVVRLDEEALTRELMHRRRRGWALLRLVPLAPHRLLAVFHREG
jgi:hypothetical protein